MSLRLRIAAASGIAVAVVALALGVLGYAATRSALRDGVDRSLAERAQPFVDGAAHGGGRTPPGEPDLGPAGGPFGGSGGEAQRVLPDGSVQRAEEATGTIPVDERVLAIAASGSGRYLRDAHVDGVHLRVLTLGVGEGGAVQVARPLAEADDALSRLLLLLGIASGGAVVLAAALGGLVARTALAPVRRFTRETEAAAAAGDATRRLDVAGGDELARLARSFNVTLDALERSVEAQRQLVADASHELRTPIASLRANIQVLEDADRLPPDDRAALRADIVSELDELTALVADVVELARGTRASERLDDVRLDELARSLGERFERRFPGLVVEVAAEEAVVAGDPERIARAVSNLLDNARKWAPPGTPLEVAVRDGWVAVRDHGPGFDEADLPHVFDRFFRSAAARGTSGSGLGLAIVRQAAESHGGRAEAANAPGGGAVVRVRFSA